MSETSFKHISGQAAKEQVIVFGGRLFDARPFGMIEAQAVPAATDGQTNLAYMLDLAKFLLPRLDERRITDPEQLKALVAELPSDFKLDESDTPTDLDWLEGLRMPIMQTSEALTRVMATLIGTEDLDLPEAESGEGKAKPTGA